jgi:hypothetical protein
MDETRICGRRFKSLRFMAMTRRIASATGMGGGKRTERQRAAVADQGKQQNLCRQTMNSHPHVWKLTKPAPTDQQEGAKQVFWKVTL